MVAVSQAVQPMTQVDIDHYRFQTYMSLAHWGSYWKQLDLVLRCKPRRVLVVGIGDGVVPRYLVDQGVAVDTLDLDPNLRPTIVGDVRTLSSSSCERYDVVLCCQVLEHMPFEDFEAALHNLLCVTKTLIVSLPYSHVLVGRLEVRLPIFGRAKLSITVPKFWQKWRFDGQHYWELGTRGFGVGHFRSWLGKRCHIQGECSTFSNPYHRFYVLTALRRTELES